MDVGDRHHDGRQRVRTWLPPPAVNPKNLLMAISAGVIIGSAALPTRSVVIVVIIFTAIAGCSVSVPVIGYLVAAKAMAKPSSPSEPGSSTTTPPSWPSSSSSSASPWSAKESAASSRGPWPQCQMVADKQSCLAGCTYSRHWPSPDGDSDVGSISSWRAGRPSGAPSVGRAAPPAAIPLGRRN